MRSLRVITAGSLSLAFSATSDADAITTAAGWGQGITLYEVVLQLDRSTPVHEYSHSQLTFHMDFGLLQFQSHDGGGSHRITRALDAIGKLRWERTPVAEWAPFMEFGLGLAGFSQTTIAGIRHLGGGFEFTEVLRTGLRLGAGGQFELGVLGQHFSNAGISPPNEGITYVGVSASWYFR